MRAIPNLPTGAPGWRLRHLAAHYHAFGPRAFLDFVEQLVDGRLPDSPSIVAFLEQCARTDPALIEAAGGYELEPPIRDVTWVIENDPEPPGGVPKRRRTRPVLVSTNSSVPL
jgi:hypothetical protein